MAEKVKEKREIEPMDWCMIAFFVIGTIVIAYAFFKGLFMVPWTGM